MTEETAQYDAGTAPIALPTLAELFVAWERGKLIADAKILDAKNASAYVDQVRALIQQRLQADGLTSTTDAATGINARIEQRSDWKITDEVKLRNFLVGDPYHHFMLSPNATAVRKHYKDCDRDMSVWGLERVQSDPFLKITPAKGQK